jgi:cation/acetate symporter
LMLALFLGTASLPHVLIRYYTVATPRDARKSTIVAIAAIALATVLGTVSGLFVASAGAVAHDLMTSVLKIKFTDKGKVFAGKIAAISVGIVAALTIIMLSPSMIVRFGLEASSAPWTLENPAIIAVPLSFLALIVVSLLTQKQKKTV